MLYYEQASVGKTNRHALSNKMSLTSLDIQYYWFSFDTHSMHWAQYGMYEREHKGGSLVTLGRIQKT